jgi:membrane associated rhomboid family serine protease
VLGSEISTGHEVGLIVVAVVFIAFALASSFLLPRYRPDFPGPAGLSVFAIASIVLFGLMVAAVNFFG